MGVLNAGIKAFSRGATEAEQFARAERDAEVLRAKITDREMPKYRAKLKSDLVRFGIASDSQDAEARIDHMLSSDDPISSAKDLLVTNADAADRTHKAYDFGNTVSSLVDSTQNNQGLPDGMLSRLLMHESHLMPRAISPKGALGIAQFMPATAAAMHIDPMDPQQAIPAAGSYLRQLHDQFGSWREALAAYNWGPGNLSKYGMGAIPKETQTYVDSILANPQADMASGPAAAIQRAKAMLKLQAGAQAAPVALPVQDAVPRGTPSVASRLTPSPTSSKVLSLSQVDPDDAMHLLMSLGSGNDEQSDGLLELLASLEGDGGSAADLGAVPQ